VVVIKNVSTEGPSDAECSQMVTVLSREMVSNLRLIKDRPIATLTRVFLIVGGSFIATAEFLKESAVLWRSLLVGASEESTSSDSLRRRSCDA